MTLVTLCCATKFDLDVQQQPHLSFSKYSHVVEGSSHLSMLLQIRPDNKYHIL
jgi:hypothetical protein